MTCTDIALIILGLPVAVLATLQLVDRYRHWRETRRARGKRRRRLKIDLRLRIRL